MRKINAGIDSAKSIFFGVDGVGWGGSAVYFCVNRNSWYVSAETRRNWQSPRSRVIAVIARDRKPKTQGIYGKWTQRSQWNQVSWGSEETGTGRLGRVCFLRFENNGNSRRLFSHSRPGNIPSVQAATAEGAPPSRPTRA